MPGRRPTCRVARRAVSVRRGSITHSSRSPSVSGRSVTIGSGSPLRCPWLTTGLQPRNIVNRAVSGSSVGTRPGKPLINRDTNGLHGVSIVPEVYFERLPSTRHNRSAVRRPLVSNADPVASSTPTASGPCSAIAASMRLARSAERGVPRDRSQLAVVAAHEWPVDAVGVVVPRAEVAALGTRVAVRQRMVGVTAHPGHTLGAVVGLDVDHDAARGDAEATERAPARHRFAHHAVIPPSTGIATPVVHADSSEARYTAMLAMSSTDPTRPSG